MSFETNKIVNYFININYIDTNIDKSLKILYDLGADSTLSLPDP